MREKLVGRADAQILRVIPIFGVPAWRGNSICTAVFVDGEKGRCFCSCYVDKNHVTIVMRRRGFRSERWWCDVGKGDGHSRSRVLRRDTNCETRSSAAATATSVCLCLRFLFPADARFTPGYTYRRKDASRALLYTVVYQVAPLNLVKYLSETFAFSLRPVWFILDCPFVFSFPVSFYVDLRMD